MLEECQRNLRGLVKYIILGRFKTKYALFVFFLYIKKKDDENQQR